jgi:SAM-dependent methyltransferase
MAAFFSLHGRPTVATEYKGIPECALPGQHAAIFETFRKVVPAGSRVLDLASGHGAWARRLSDHGYATTACDIRPDLCMVPCTRLDLNDAFSTQFAPEFDAVTAIEMLEHVENPRHIAREANRLMKPGGKLIFSTPNASGLHSRVKFLFTGRFAQFDDHQYNAIGHIRPLTHWELDKILTEAGFSTLSVSFHNNYDLIPRTIGEIVKMASSLLLAPFVRGVAGGQTIIMVAEKVRDLR